MDGLGGGMDVTPCLSDENLKKWLHNELKKTCNKHNKNYYKKYKKWCEKYFFLFSIFSISLVIMSCKITNQFLTIFFFELISILNVKLSYAFTQNYSN